MMRRSAVMVFAASFLLLAAGWSRMDREPGFDHWKHRKLFVACETCHAGAATKGQAMYPAPASCASCHDGKVTANGTVLAKVTWQPGEPRISNLKFAHSSHSQRIARERGTDSTVTCMECHGQAGASWMQVQAAPVQDNCFSCHQLRTAHFSAPDTACATCHLPLAEAAGLTRDRVAHFPKPDSHKAPGFARASGHGAQAKSAAAGVAQSCATCHARDFCSQCHVNAPEVRTIQALAPDARSTAIEAKLEAPAGHRASDFLSKHGGMSRKNDATCASCHTQQSCLSCHRSSPAVAMRLPPAGAGRGLGAQIERTRPASHLSDFADRHASLANSAPRSCSACHARTECLECHRPNPGNSDSYHPAGFLTRHPAAAYGRQSDCSQCHNAKAFCTDCHIQSGLVSSNGLLAGNFHDAKSGFLLGHGQAARQNLETCTTCHSERDCLTCHSAQTRGFNPHGPDFDADRLRRKNPQTCAACHGRNIPGR